MFCLLHLRIPVDGTSCFSGHLHWQTSCRGRSSRCSPTRQEAGTTAEHKPVSPSGRLPRKPWSGPLLRELFLLLGCAHVLSSRTRFQTHTHTQTHMHTYKRTHRHTYPRAHIHTRPQSVLADSWPKKQPQNF